MHEFWLRRNRIRHLSFCIVSCIIIDHKQKFYLALH